MEPTILWIIIGFLWISMVFALGLTPRCDVKICQRPKNGPSEVGIFLLLVDIWCDEVYYS